MSIREMTTFRQREVIEAIRSFTKEHGYAPTWRDLADILGLRSTNAVTCHLRPLMRKGIVTWDPRCARSIRLIDPGSGDPAPCIILMTRRVGESAEIRVLSRDGQPRWNMREAWVFASRPEAEAWVRGNARLYPTWQATVGEAHGAAVRLPGGE